MPKIKIEFEVDEKYCGDCRYFDNTESAFNCCELFHTFIKYENCDDAENLRCLRCPACIAAEVKDNA